MAARSSVTYFRIVGPIRAVRTFATGTAIRELPRLRRIYGRGRWRKRADEAAVELPNGERRVAEIHWYEATGIGRHEFKIKRFVD